MYLFAAVACENGWWDQPHNNKHGLFRGFSQTNSTPPPCRLQQGHANTGSGDGNGSMEHHEQELQMREQHQDDEEEGSSGNGGYTFDTPEHKEQLKAQRQQLWQCASMGVPM